MKIIKVTPQPDFSLIVETDTHGFLLLDVKPYLKYEAFLPLADYTNFQKVFSGGYYIEWSCGADLSADTIEAKATSLKTQTDDTRRCD